MCDYCGCDFYRSQLVRDPAGLLACEDDQEGRDTVTLNRLEAQAVAEATAEVAQGRKEPW